MWLEQMFIWELCSKLSNRAWSVNGTWTIGCILWWSLSPTDGPSCVILIHLKEVDKRLTSLLSLHEISVLSPPESSYWRWIKHNIILSFINFQLDSDYLDSTRGSNLLIFNTPPSLSHSCTVCTVYVCVVSWQPPEARHTHKKTVCWKTGLFARSR